MQIVHDYRSLHTIPELDRTLPRTNAYIRRQLASLKCQIFSPTPGSICAFFSFGHKKAIAFRADTDALPIFERTSLPWKSQHTGQMHACGHDGHTAILLELARRINREKFLPKNILLIFQPAEETTGGAEAICNSGIFEKYSVSHIYALHLWPGLEKGYIYSKPACLMSQCTSITLRFTGRGGHIADAQHGCDALQACCTFYTASGYIKAPRPFLLKFGKICGGTSGNILCNEAKLCGSLRTLEGNTEQQVRTALFNLCRQTEKQTGCHCEIFYNNGYPAIENDKALLYRIQKIHPIRILDEAYWTGEDFSFYQKKVPGVYFLLGLGSTPPLHSAEFSFDETVLAKGVDFFWNLIEK